VRNWQVELLGGEMLVRKIYNEEHYNTQRYWRLSGNRHKAESHVEDFGGNNNPRTCPDFTVQETKQSSMMTCTVLESYCLGRRKTRYRRVFRMILGT
jgi:hypothetical protein